MTTRTTIDYDKERICKNSIRYKKKGGGAGPVTIYVPNEMIADLSNPPDTIQITMQQFWKK